jgi:hypothetical protein
MAKGIEKLFFKTALVSVAFSQLFLGLVFAEEPDAVVLALSGYHFKMTATELEKVAGGKENLVKKLLEIHRLESPPFVGIRATRLLLNYADRPEVASALVDDVSNYTGLARVVATNIETVPSESAKKTLAKAVLSKARTDEKLKVVARTLIDSSDAEIRELAKEASK